MSHHISKHIKAALFDHDDTLVAPQVQSGTNTSMWLESEAIRPDEVIYVGDGLHDMKAALGAGFSFLGVETGSKF